MDQVVYVASPETQQIHVWAMNQVGELSLLQTVSTPGQVQPMVVSHDKKHLYIGVGPHLSVVTYDIEPQGTLRFKAQTCVPGKPVHLSLDNSGKFLFVPSYHQHNLAVLPIGSDGVAGAPIQVIEGLRHPHSSHMDADNQQLWVPCLGEDHIRLFDLANNGYLTEATADQITTAPKAGPRHLALHPREKVIYCLNELDSTINVYHKFTRYREMQNVALYPEGNQSQRWAADIHITPNGRYLYASERSESYLAHYQVSENGCELSLVGRYPTQAQPRGFNIDPSGRFLVSSGQKSDHISVSEIDSITGKLTELARYKASTGCMWVTFR
ncbi:MULTISPECIES: 6-phosphogluconolactonase [Providencia]|uniref:6-phosphogluconolactonase n=1 Tax=Providencia TaxID=586 RepID=UPI0003E2C743|nr:MULTISPECIES: 6-phosphogluconolactonase [Providencia]ETT02042.1 putative 6-phosphogluconolactonase [Providencia alcalifaciens PAL-3]EUC99564.1 putative 6-phosphogluconolactonase [Providencia alcalifaciens PAL-1]MTB47468.1 6-phosphogluconolactonase [Providencia sp. wls1950]MTC24373.1 6-phosphogluconolactonase [Providencia sp. wls1938]MTC44360.1 6-phosphogluconolactonase [Providencia sp. wls1922]